MTNKTTTSYLLAGIRKEKGYNQKQVANHLGIQQSAYSRREINPTSFTVLEMQKIIDFLNLTFDEQQLIFEWGTFALSNQEKLKRIQRDPEKWRRILEATCGFIERILIENEKYMRVQDMFYAIYNSTELAYDLDFQPNDFEQNGRALGFFMPLFEMKLRKADLKSKEFRAVRAKNIQNTMKKILQT